MPLRENFCCIILAAVHSYQHHFFRQVDISTLCILLVNWCNHQFIAQQQLVFYLFCHGIIWEIKRQRLEHHLIVQSSLQKFAIEIRNQAISNLNHFASSFNIGELIEFLFPCTVCGVVAEQRCKQGVLQPTNHEIFRCIAAESARI